MTPADAGHAARLFVLIPCAGTGSRAGSGAPKQYRQIGGRSVVARTLDVFRALGPRVARIALLVAPEDHGAPAALPGFPADREQLLHVGGATRAATVRRGLEALLSDGARPHDWAMVHDAARCLVTPSLIEALFAACENDAVGGLLAQPLADTLKVSSPDGRAIQTLSRADKWLAQTPQMFRCGLLHEALTKAGDGVTDEASAVELLGLSPRLVPGSARNFKLTHPDDFALAEALLDGHP